MTQTEAELAAKLDRLGQQITPGVFRRDRVQTFANDFGLELQECAMSSSGVRIHNSETLRMFGEEVPPEFALRRTARRKPLKPLLPTAGHDIFREFCTVGRWAARMVPARVLADYEALLDRGKQVSLNLTSSGNKLHPACDPCEANISTPASRRFSHPVNRGRQDPYLTRWGCAQDRHRSGGVRRCAR